MFGGGREATWCACHTSGCCRGCRCVVFITSPVSMAPCALVSCCDSGSQADIALPCQRCETVDSISKYKYWVYVINL